MKLSHKQIAKKGGIAGGAVRAERLSTEQKRDISRMGVLTRLMKIKTTKKVEKELKKEMHELKIKKASNIIKQLKKQTETMRKFKKDLIADRIK